MKYDYKPDPEIDKEYVLSRISQEEIFEHYLGVEVQTSEHIRSPLRRDKHPTCNFDYHRGKLYFMDWAMFDSPKDCFNIVMYIYDLDFWDALEKIAADFNLVNKDVDRELRYEYEASESDPKDESSPTLIEVKKQDFTKTDIDYLNRYEITESTCEKYKVYSLRQIWLNRDCIYFYSDNDPALGYYFGTKNGIQQWKIYFYQRDSFRFICNTNRPQGYPQLPGSGEYCVITKSMKDVMCMHEFDIPAVAPQSESQLPNEQLISELQSRFNRLFSLYDFDRTGISTANGLFRKYEIPRLFLTNGRFGSVDYVAKDFSDFVAKYGREQMNKLIQEAKEYYYD